MDEHWTERVVHSETSKNPTTCQVHVEGKSIGQLRTGSSDGAISGNRDVFERAVGSTGVRFAQIKKRFKVDPARLVLDIDEEVPIQYLVRLIASLNAAGLGPIEVVGTNRWKLGRFYYQ